MHTTWHHCIPHVNSKPQTSSFRAYYYTHLTTPMFAWQTTIKYIYKTSHLAFKLKEGSKELSDTSKGREALLCSTNSHCLWLTGKPSTHNNSCGHMQHHYTFPQLCASGSSTQNNHCIIATYIITIVGWYLSRSTSLDHTCFMECIDLEEYSGCWQY